MWIRIKSIKLFGFHGVYDAEKERGSTFEFDVDVRLSDIGAQNDELTDTVDYTKIISIVEKKSSARSYNLIETLASDICRDVSDLSPHIEEVIARVRKYVLPIETELQYVEAEQRMLR